MPWIHAACDEIDIYDNEACSNCGERNQTWSVTARETRGFKIRRQPWLELELLAEEEQPCSGDPFIVTLADGRQRLQIHAGKPFFIFCVTYRGTLGAELEGSAEGGGEAARGSAPVEAEKREN